MLKLNYDKTKFNFDELLRECYGVENLENIHLSLDSGYEIPSGVKGLGNDTDSKYHKMFYNKLNSGWSDFEKTYVNFIKENIMQYMKVDTLVYQAKPSFRIQYPNSHAVTTWHFDSDKNHRHPDWEINVQVALTEMKDSTSTWIESVPGLRDFKPMEMNVGDFYIFNGNKCLHGNKPNKSGKTRISFDFRVLPYDRYDDSFENTSATKKQKFLIGGYYNAIMGREDK
jgi:hypothetical protein